MALSATRHAGRFPEIPVAMHAPRGSGQEHAPVAESEVA